VNTYTIKIFSEMQIQFSAGNVYLVQSNIEIDQKELFYSNDAFYLNYPFLEAVKVIPFFENLAATEQKRIARSLQNCIGFKVRLDDLFGKMLIALIYHIELHSFVIVGLVGLSDSSIDMLIKILKEVVFKERSKVVIMTKTTSSLKERIIVTTF
jgi:hypothetical protein